MSTTLTKPLFNGHHTMQRDSELSSLAIDITALEDNSKFHQSQALVYAARAGAKIAQAKESLPHGTFIDWIEENTNVSRQHAHNYMRLAAEYPQLLDDSNVKSNLHLPSVSQAIVLMTANDEVKEEVRLRLENGENITVSEIKQLKQNYDHLSKDNTKVFNLYNQSIKEIEEKETEIERLEKELEELVKEGGIDKLIAEKTLESSVIVNEMQAAQDNLRDQISKLKNEQEKTINTRVEIELHKKQKEIDALEEKTRRASSELETIQSKINQCNSLDTLDNQFQQAAVQLLNGVVSAELLINTTDVSSKLFNHKTIKLLVQTAEQCRKLADAFDDLAVVKQADLDSLMTIKIPEPEPKYFYYMTENGKAGYKTITDKLTTYKKFRAEIKKVNNVVVTAYRSTDDIEIGFALESYQGRWCFETNEWID